MESTTSSQLGMLLHNAREFVSKECFTEDTGNFVSYDIGFRGDVFNPEVNGVVNHESTLETSERPACWRVFCSFLGPRLRGGVVTIIQYVRIRIRG